MKININNKTNLPIKIIGDIYDKWSDKNKDRMVVIINGMKEHEFFEYKKKDYQMTIEHKLTCLNILVKELHIFAKKVSMKDVKFPRLPKKKH